MAAVAGLALVLSACGGGDDDDLGGSTSTATEEGGGDKGDGQPPSTDEPSEEGFSGKVDPCELITSDDAEEFLDVPVSEAERSGSGPYNVCTYNAKDPLQFKFLIVQVRDDVLKSEFDDERTASEGAIGSSFQGVDGVGDSAYDIGGLLFAHKGDTAIVVSAVTGLSLDETDPEGVVLELNTRIAMRALERLN
mgnify:CR=1 FL=1